MQKGFPSGSSGEELTCQCRRHKRCRFESLGQEDSPEEGHGNPFQYSCLENPVDRGACGLQSIGLKKSETTEVT